MRPKTTEKTTLIRPLSLREHSSPGRVSAPERSPNGAGNRAEGTGPKGPKPRAKTSQEPRNSFYPPRNAFYPFLENSSFLRKNVPFLRNENSRTPHTKHVKHQLQILQLQILQLQILQLQILQLQILQLTKL